MNIASFFDSDKNDTIIYVNKKPLTEFNGSEMNVYQLLIKSESFVKVETTSLNHFPNLEEITIIGVECTDFSFLKLSLKMKCLTIEKCNLSIIPMEVNVFSDIEHLDLSKNNILQIANTKWSSFTKLKYLNLGDNQITSVLDEGIWSGAIEELHLYGNPIKNLKFNIKNQDSELKKLSLSATEVTEIPSGVYKLKKLEDLKLSFTKILSLPNELKMLKSLKRLDLSGIKFKEIPNVIFELLALEELVIDWTRLSGVELVSTPINAYTLKTLSIAFDHLSTIPEWVQFFPHILELHAENNPIEIIPEWLAKFPYLQFIYLSEEASIEEEKLSPTFDKRQWAILY